MILGFKPQFKPLILSGSKKHSIRADPHKRWKAEKTIHMATEVRTKNYDCFKIDKCRSTQEIEIVYEAMSKAVFIDDTMMFRQKMSTGRTVLGHDFIKNLAENDGFDSVDDFFKWFDRDFTGVIIHWTDLKY